MSTNPSPRPAQQVFDLDELNEMVLLQRDPEDILNHLHEDATLYQAVKASTALQTKLFMTQKPPLPLDPESPYGGSRKYLQLAKPNHLLISNDKLSRSFRIDHNGAQYRLQRHYDHRTPDDFPPEGEDSRFVYMLIRNECKDMVDGEPAWPILAPAYLSLHLADRAIPLHVVTYDETSRIVQNSKQQRTHFGTRRRPLGYAGLPQKLDNFALDGCRTARRPHPLAGPHVHGDDEDVGCAERHPAVRDHQRLRGRARGLCT